MMNKRDMAGTRMQVFRSGRTVPPRRCAAAAAIVLALACASKAAFGTAGFGAVAGVGVHNSP